MNSLDFSPLFRSTIGFDRLMRLELTAVPGQQMNRSRLQVDTVRYFTLKSPNKKPVDAPATMAGLIGSSVGPAKQRPDGLEMGGKERRFKGAWAPGNRG